MKHTYAPPKYIGYIKLAAWNIVAMLLCAINPVARAAPFGCALAAAAGVTALKPWRMLPGCIAGCVMLGGADGAFASLGCVAAFYLARLLSLREWNGEEADSALAAFFAALVPALVGVQVEAYRLVTAILCACLALAAAPLMLPIIKEGALDRCAAHAREERIGFLLIFTLALAGISVIRGEAGLFLCGLFAITLSAGGVQAGTLGGLLGGAALLAGGYGARELALIVFCASVSGAAAEIGAWAQALVFLLGLPLGAYFGWQATDVYLLAAAPAFILMPRAWGARLRLSALAPSRTERVGFRIRASRRHAAPAGERVCGDAGAITPLKDGRMLLMLADGMGTGEAARKLSARTVRLARALLLGDIDAETTYRALNRLTLEEGAERFCTLDVCVVDLKTGQAEFHKCGGEPAWVMGALGVKRIESASLPVGILPEAPPARTRAKLKNGDIVLLATDGLANALGGCEEMGALLKHLGARSPSEICRALIDEARARGRETRADDMSVLCARITKRRVFASAHASDKQVS